MVQGMSIFLKTEQFEVYNVVQSECMEV
jgi:hypothetical protein